VPDLDSSTLSWLICRGLWQHTDPYIVAAREPHALGLVRWLIDSERSRTKDGQRCAIVAQRPGHTATTANVAQRTRPGHGGSNTSSTKGDVACGDHGDGGSENAHTPTTFVASLSLMFVEAARANNASFLRWLQQPDIAWLKIGRWMIPANRAMYWALHAGARHSVDWLIAEAGGAANGYSEQLAYAAIDVNDRGAVERIVFHPRHAAHIDRSALVRRMAARRNRWEMVWWAVDALGAALPADLAVIAIRQGRWDDAVEAATRAGGFSEACMVAAAAHNRVEMMTRLSAAECAWRAAPVYCAAVDRKAVDALEWLDSRGCVPSSTEVQRAMRAHPTTPGGARLRRWAEATAVRRAMLRVTTTGQPFGWLVPPQ
jgi:hypothetical protein